MTTLHHEWESFRREVLEPAQAGPVQVKETRRAFYAGARVLLTMIGNISDQAETDDAGAAQIELIDQELKRFNEAVKAGKA